MFRCHPYQPRAIGFAGTGAISGHQIKQYTVRFGDEPLDEDRFAAGVQLAAAALPQPPTATGRPGLGLIIRHQGRGADYVVLAWWDRENELPLRVFVRDGGAWRPARDAESVCVWDLEILWFERQAYVAHVLAPADRQDLRAYLATGLRDPR